MEKRRAVEGAFILVTFAASALYYQRTQCLRIDREFYEASMSYVQKRAFLSRGPPLPYMLLAAFVHAMQTLASRASSAGSNEFLLLSFNVLGSVIITLNVVLTYSTLRTLSGPRESLCGVILFYTSPLAAGRMSVLSPTLFTFTLFSLCMCMLVRFVVHPSPTHAPSLALSIGALLSSTWMACVPLLVFAARIFLWSYQSACDPRIRVVCRTIFTNIALVLFSLAAPLVVYVATFYVYISNQKECPRDMWDLSIEYRASLEPVPEPCDRFVLDRALVTILNKSTQSHITQDASVCGSRDKSPGAVWRVIKIHVETAPNYSPDSEESTFIQNNDIVKLMHLQTGMYLGTEGSSDANTKFLKVEALNTDDNTDDGDLWRVISDSPFIEARQSLFQLRHVVTGRMLGIKADGTSVCASHDSREDLRYFYVEDAYNEEYYRRNYKDARVRHKAVHFPQLGFLEKFMELNYKLGRMLSDREFTWASLGLADDRGLEEKKPAGEIPSEHRMRGTYILMLAIYPAALVLSDVLYTKLGKDMGFSMCSYFLCAQWLLTAVACLFCGVDAVYFFYLAVVALVDVFSKVPFVLVAFTGASLAVLYEHYHSLVQLK